jgi:hypothetical protein
MTMLPFSKSLLAGSLLLLLQAPTAVELKLKESDHKNLSKLVAAYYTATEEKKGINESLLKVLDQIEATDKRLKKEKILASVGDWEQVFRLVAESRLKESFKKKGEVASVKAKSEVGLDLSLAYCAPKKPAKGALPLILIACDAGEVPADHLAKNWADPVLRETAYLVALDMGKDTSTWSVFGSKENPGGPFTVMAAVGTMLREFQVDTNRIFLIGSGQGFAAAEATAASFPQTFAAVIGLGEVSSSDLGNLENFRNLPTLFSKECDGTKAIKAKLDELGYGNCTISATGAEGEAKTEGTPAATIEWIGKVQRNAYPKHLTFAPKSDFARAAHWLTLSGMQAAEGPRIEAKADRVENTITIDADKIANLVIYLNDELVDLSKPVRFMINGKPFERTVERSAGEMIKNQYNVGDWGRVFTAAVLQDVPAK